MVETKLELETFLGLKGSTFEICFEVGFVAAELKNVVVRGKDPKGTRDLYSLYFLAQISAVQAQGTYVVKSAQMGEFAIFLVPVSQNDWGVEYEAIFN